MPEIETLELFAKFGLAGLLLAALLVITVTGIWMVRHIVREMSEDRNKAFQEMSADRNAAESRWLETFVQVSEQSDKRASQTNEVIRDLSSAIKIMEGKLSR